MDPVLIVLIVLLVILLAARYQRLEDSRLLLAVLVLLLVWVLLGRGGRLHAQTLDACTVVPPGTTFTLTGASAPLLTWTMNEQVPVSPTDPTLVPQRIDGFFVQIDSLTRIDTGKLAPATCGDGRMAFQFRWPANVARGNHTASVRGWSFALDASGNPTTQKVEGAVTTVPFGVVDPVQLTPPEAPANVKVKK